MYSFLFVLCACIIVVLCENASYDLGVLSQGCINHYHRLYFTRAVPPRTYQYYHEYMEEPQEEINDFRFRIVGGQQISIEQAPYTVLYGKYCGGTLIAPYWVITAAHCKNVERYVYAGATRRNIAIEQFRHTICAHYVHPRWDAALRNHDFDYQLLLLEVPVPVTPQSRPIAIGSPDDIRTGAMVAVTGWGHLRHKEKMQDILRRVFVPIMDFEECRSLPVKDYQGITARMFCAGYMNGTKDSCQGDSGGPAVMDGFLVGLVSFGVGCAQRGQPGVYTIIPLAREWIRNVTALPL